MKTLKHILSHYTAFLWALLKPLGAWGVFAIAALDGSLLGMPLDAIVAGYVYTDHARFPLYVLMASAGSVAGSMVIYGIGYLGGEAFLRRRIPAERFAKIHASFEKHPIWGLMFPAILPPPTPFKLFVLAAAVSEMQFSHFLLAIFGGRLIRFTILALLTLKFGPQIVEISATLFRTHLNLLLFVIGAGLALWWVLHRVKKKKKRREATAQS